MMPPVKRKVLLVINPSAGKGKATTVILKVCNWMKQQEIDFNLLPTVANMCVSDAIRNELKHGGYTDVIAVGGDGTINEAVNGMRGFAIPLGIIPAGTGNDYVKNFPIGLEISEHLTTALYGKLQEVDLGECNGRLFVNGMGIGFDGQIAANMTKGNSWIKGHALYLYHVLKILMFYRHVKLTGEVDGEPFQKSYFLWTIAKGTTFGGGFKLTPHASLHSGRLAICEIRPIHPIRRIFNLAKLSRGSHNDIPEVTFSYAKTISIQRNDAAMTHLDGEFIGSPPFEIRIVPKALLVRVGGT